ncbi:MAG TPA: pyridoxamine 5'-phosphate oxidase family protein [Oligoflexus sp.]|uniref:pyridoxamine 5'-phosphate oxidase family protein n=1 Tax=Oligoflexus sp. TaxID=1971216 RepID=UPI002D2B8322|nr:pyridoxamine 5'-phosphate oxidase family protein [Oligoflexus sp.]HYX33314.1 pyridoxamine 5'-phosphate oxidase family protein [Oligoflexus sp.]
MDSNVKEARNKAWEHLQKLIRDVEVAMLTTVSGEDFLRSRPMMTQETDEDGVLWFFTSDHQAKAQELSDDPRVNVSYSKAAANQFVSVSGLGEVVHDEEKKRKLWKPIYKSWFPDGVDDPHLALLKVYIEKAEYWDAPASTWVEVAGFAKALLTGKPYEHSREEHDTIDLMKNPLSGSNAETSPN